jgi:hypothetical protein
LLCSIFLLRCGESLDADAPQSGRWREYRTHRFDPHLTDAQRESLEQLEAIGYLRGERPARTQSGVTLYDRERAHAGWNLYTSGHAAEAILMDMQGNLRHRWRCDFWDVWPDYPVKKGQGETQYFRRAYLYENGDLLAIYEGLGLVKLDKDSNLIWSNPIKAHHDLEVMPNGDIYVLTREAHMVPRVDPQNPVLEDFISIIDATGTERRRISLLSAFEGGNFPRIWPGSRDPSNPYDLFHTNSLRLLSGQLEGRAREFQRGRFLTSMLMLDAIAVVDLDRQQVVWARQGVYRSQHDPRVLANGNLLLFDNLGAEPVSRVLELDPVTGQIRWEYRGTADRPFFTKCCGSARRLPNGNTLITESDNGRAFEVTDDNQLVWEFHSPHLAGDQGQFVATLFDVVRLEPGFPIDWLPDAAQPAAADR